MFVDVDQHPVVTDLVHGKIGDGAGDDGVGQRMAKLEQKFGQKVVGGSIIRGAVAQVEQMLLQLRRCDFAGEVPLGEVSIGQLVGTEANVQFLRR